MAQPWNHATILLVVAVLSVVVMVADGAEGCAQVGTGEMAEAGSCPPVKVHVPYPGFSGVYGVNAMYRHAGVKPYTDPIDGTLRNASWYAHNVALSAEHPASLLQLYKTYTGNTAVWKLVRRVLNNTVEQEVLPVSECSKSVEFPWLCTSFDPPIEVSEMTWDEAHQYSLDAVKETLRYAETVKHLRDDQATEVLHRAAGNVQKTIARVK